ncbi:venom protease-like [Panulirus ornatus]|uniref:venom protease-like n=1 Tax=Panulirus ornatus TaxID=150431 RepID=UPI003A84541A
MLTFQFLMLLGIALTQGQETNNKHLSTVTITLGNADGTCGGESECNVYLPLASQFGNESMMPFFRTSFGRLLLRYTIRCCRFEHPLLSKPSSIIPTENECGFSAPETYLDIQKPGAWPWLVVVGNKNTTFRFICGGTLITKRHVLTGAHCAITDVNTVRVGVLSLAEDDSTFQEFSVTKTIHPEYNPNRHQNDIAILTLPQDVTFTDYVRPACLPFPQRHSNFTGKELVVVGFGDTSFGGKPSLVPVAVALPVTDIAECNKAYQNVERSFVVTENQICMREEHQGSCHGDGGSPLNYFSPSVRRYYVAGIVSFGYDCGNPDFPGVYTRVGAYLDWIVENL